MMSECTQLSNILLMNNETSALKEGINTIKSQVSDLYAKNEKRRTAQEDLNIKMVRLMDQLEETSHQVSGQTALFEQIHVDVKCLTTNVHKLTNEVDVVKKDIEDIKDRRFNWSKFLGGLVSRAGVIWLICITIIISIASGFGDQIFSSLKAILGVKV